ncbi:hypothetical protein VTK26DRAFT_2356 [Humicola hyalothermophila]
MRCFMLLLGSLQRSCVVSRCLQYQARRILAPLPRLVPSTFNGHFPVMPVHENPSSLRLSNPCPCTSFSSTFRDHHQQVTLHNI